MKRRSLSAVVGYAFGALIVAWLLIALADIDQRKQLVLGVGSGALVGAIGLGIVLTYRGSGVVNFASGAMAMYGGYTYNGLRTSGTLLLPPIPNPLSLIELIAQKLGANSLELPELPAQWSLNDGQPLSFAVSLLVTLLVAAAMGALIYLLIFRPLRQAPPLAKAVASVGLFITLQAIVVLRFGDELQSVQPILPQTRVTFWGVTTFRSYYLIAGIVIAIAAAFWALFKLTRFGLATRAAAENEKGAVLLGFSPDRLAVANWVLASVLSALLGVLAAPIVGLHPSLMSLLVVPALASALLGGFTSFGVTVASALGIGMAQALITYYSTRDWFPKIHGSECPGVKDAFVVLVIIVALTTQGQSLPTRGNLSTVRLPYSPRPTRVLLRAAVAALVCAAALLTLDFRWRIAIINTLVGIAICLSLVLLTGLVGQISLAQMAFAGVAGFFVSTLAVGHGIGFPWGPLAGATVAAVVGVLVAIPALRVRGVNLAVVTLALAVFVENCIFKLTTSNGNTDSVEIPPPRFLGLQFGPLDATSYKPLADSSVGKVPNPFFGLFCLAVVVVAALAVSNVRRSTTGRHFLAVRSNERAAAASGVNVAGTKLLAFGMSAFIAGLGGALSGYRFGSVTPQYFGSIQSLIFFAFAYLGGIASVTGAVVSGFLVAGGICFVVLKEWLGVSDQYTFLIGGVGLILTAVRDPDGITGALRGTGRKIEQRRWWRISRRSAS